MHFDWDSVYQHTAAIEMYTLAKPRGGDKNRQRQWNMEGTRGHKQCRCTIHPSLVEGNGRNQTTSHNAISALSF